MKQFVPSLCTVLALASMSCSQMSPNVYSTKAAGVAVPTYAGVIEAARPVTVQGEGKVGTVLGAAAGGLGGAQLGGGTAVPIIAGIGGAVIGGMAGRGLEKGVSKKEAIEYVVRSEDGQLHTIVQGVESPLRVGQPVFVQFNGPDGRARIVAKS